MALTRPQLVLLAAAIVAETDPDFVALRNSGATGAMADWYNATAAPAIKAWRNGVDPREVDAATPWSNFDAITSAGKRESYLHAFLRYPRNFSAAAVRRWITDVWGAAVANSDAAAILTGAGLRDITRAEAVLGGANAVATGTVSARRLTWEGLLTNEDIVQAVNPLPLRATV